MSYEKLKSLLNQQNPQITSAYLETISNEDLCETICDKICNLDVLKVLEGTLKLFGASENEKKKKRKLITKILDTIKSVEITSNHMNNIINIIILNFPTFPVSQLKYLVDYCLNSINDENDEAMCWKDILPGLLELLQDEKLVIYDASSVTGLEYKSLVIKSICSERWNRNILTPLAKMFREIPLSKQELDVVNKALCGKIMSVHLNELPPLVHEMLILIEEDTKLLIITLCKYFSKKYAEAEEEDDADGCRAVGKISIKEIQDVESTVLYHIYQIALVNQKSLKDLIKFLKNNTATPEFVIEPFIMSVLLLVTEMYPEVFDILKTAVTRQVQFENKKKHSSWLRKMTNDEWSVMEVITQIIINSDNKDRHFVLQGLINFAFILMSLNDKKIKEETTFGDIGSKILHKVLQKRHASGTVILQLLTSNILESGVEDISQFTDCLSYMCRKLTLAVLDHKNWIITLIEQLPMLPGSWAIQTINAILPLIHISANIRDAFILILRKSLYNKGTGNREMAVVGFLHLLKKVKINSLNALSQNSTFSSTSSSIVLTQATLEKHKNITSNPRNNAALFEEILNILTKCFTQEFEVRFRLYTELYEIVAVNPDLAERITKMLVERFISFYNPNENIMPPVALDKCIVSQGAEMITQEPIGNLIYALQKIYIITAHRDSTFIEKLSIILESLCKRMAQLELEHLEINESVEFLDNIPNTLSKLQEVKLCITICEALIAYRIDSWSRESHNFAQNINALHKTYNLLTEFIKKIVKPRKDSKKKDKDKDGNDTTVTRKHTKNHPILQAAKIPNTIIQIRTIEKILQLLYLKSVPWTTEEQSTNLRLRTNFHHYILQTLLQLLSTAKTERPINSQKLNDYINIGKLLYKEIVLNLDSVYSFDDQTCVLGLECFKELCDFICTCMIKELPTFLEAICDVERCEGLDAQIREIIPIMLNIIINNIEQAEETEEGLRKKIPAILLETISHLLHKMPFEKGDNAKVLKCLYKIALEDESKSITNSITQLLLLVDETIDPKSKILNEMCDELLCELGTIDESVYECERKLKIINESSVKEIYQIVSSAVKSKLLNVDWYFNRLKAQHSSLVAGFGNDSAHEDLQEAERQFCSQLNVIIEMMELLTNTRVPGFFSDLIFKNAQLLFIVLCKLTKYFHAKSTADNPTFQSVGFLTVIKRAGKEVKNNIYNLITYVEMNQNVDGSKDNNTLRNKVLRETKTIPRVIYEMEQFQKDLILLEKKTGVPMEKFIKKAINRAFKIRDRLLEEGLEKMDVSALNTQASNYVVNDDETGTETNLEESVSATPGLSRKKKKKVGK